MEFLVEMLSWIPCIAGVLLLLLLILCCVLDAITKGTSFLYEDEVKKKVEKLFASVTQASEWLGQLKREKARCSELEKDVESRDKRIEELEMENKSMKTEQRRLQKIMNVVQEGFDGGFDAEAIKDQVEYVKGQFCSTAE
jgi:hypothetical protein